MAATSGARPGYTRGAPGAAISAARAGYEMFRFDNTYARLPERFYARVVPSRVRAPRVVKVNGALAEALGVDAGALASAEGAAVLAGNAIPEGAEPIALAYAGHQFGAFVPQLGDGRAILLGEVVGKDGARRDLQLKGSGRTPYSRGGDGRAALGPVLREYLVSEAMAALGVPTTRALAAVTTGEIVVRDAPMPGAVLARVAASHLRVGTFELFAARDDVDALATLASYALGRHYPDAVGSGNDALALLDRVIDAQASLVARWLGVGFIHGVMNTDNTSIAGETIDYGPCAFLDEYDPNKKFSSIDVRGRYAFANQPRVALWNLTRLAEALLPLFASDEEEAARLALGRLERFQAAFEAAYDAVLAAKLGLGSGDAVAREGAEPVAREGAEPVAREGAEPVAREGERRDDRALAADLLERLAANQVDYTLFFRRLCASAADPAADAETAALFANAGAFHDWAERWRARLALERVAPDARAAAMRGVNPAFIPRNHRVEEALEAAVARGDFAPFEALLEALARPYDARADRSELARLASAPAPHERVRATFCGT